LRLSMAQYAVSSPRRGDQRVLIFAGCYGPAVADPDRGHPEGPIAGRPGPSAIPIERDDQAAAFRASAERAASEGCPSSRIRPSNAMERGDESFVQFPYQSAN